jgi:outer membrane protein TolC
MTNTSRSYTTINPAYNSLLQLLLTQPLLKGFGPRINRIDTKRAEYRADVSRAALKAALLQTIYEIEEAYWNLVDGRENLKVQELSLEQSREILRRNREGARVGTKSTIEVLGAETEVAGWEDNVLSARRQVERAEDRLRRVMNLPPGDVAAPPVPIVPTDKPDSGKRPVAYEEALNIALLERPEILTAEKELASSLGDVAYARNQTLPELNLQLSAWNPGQSGVKSIYENNDPLSGRIIGTIKGSRGDSIREVFKKWQKSWLVGLNFNLPLANVFSRANLAGARLRNEQAVLRVEERKTAVGQDVAAALKEFAACERRIASTAAYRALLEKRLEAEIERYNIGLVGSEWLFSYQRQLAQARTSESRALVDYEIARAALDRAMGTSLKTKNVKFRDYEF